MNRDTISFIVRLLNQEVNSRESSLMSCIRNKSDAYMNDRIKDYREAFDAREDFFNWVDDQDFKDGEE